jgi:hypothetical protein
MDAQGGFRCPPFKGCRGAIFVSPRFLYPLLGGFSAWFFDDGFLFPIKELGLLNNLGHWIRILDVCNVCICHYIFSILLLKTCLQ